MTEIIREGELSKTDLPILIVSEPPEHYAYPHLDEEVYAMLKLPSDGDESIYTIWSITKRSNPLTVTDRSSRCEFCGTDTATADSVISVPGISINPRELLDIYNQYKSIKEKYFICNKCFLDLTNSVSDWLEDNQDVIVSNTI